MNKPRTMGFFFFEADDGRPRTNEERMEQKNGQKKTGGEELKDEK